MIFLAHFGCGAAGELFCENLAAATGFFPSWQSRDEENEMPWKMCWLLLVGSWVRLTIMKTFRLVISRRKDLFVGNFLNFCANFSWKPRELLQKYSPLCKSCSFSLLSDQLEKITLITLIDFASWTTRENFSFLFAARLSQQVCKHCSFDLIWVLIAQLWERLVEQRWMLSTYRHVLMSSQAVHSRLKNMRLNNSSTDWR